MFIPIILVSYFWGEQLARRWGKGAPMPIATAVNTVVFAVALMAVVLFVGLQAMAQLTPSAALGRAGRVSFVLGGLAYFFVGGIEAKFGCGRDKRPES